MSDPKTEMEQSFVRMAAATQRAFGAPELAAARASACPQQMYADLLATSPARDLGDGYFSRATMADIQYATRHPAVEQGSKYLGSDRKAIPQFPADIGERFVDHGAIVDCS